MPSRFEGMSGNPLLGLTRDSDEGFEIIEAKHSAIEPCSDLRGCEKFPALPMSHMRMV